eukprot:1092999-Karenia_brevis.AAC.1
MRALALGPGVVGAGGGIALPSDAACARMTWSQCYHATEIINAFMRFASKGEGSVQPARDQEPDHLLEPAR